MNETPVQRHGHLRAIGNRIVDEHGRPVTLRGMSLFWSQWKPQFYRPSTIRWLRDDWKVDVVRAAMAVHHGGYMDHPAREMAKIREDALFGVAEYLTHVMERWPRGKLGITEVQVAPVFAVLITQLGFPEESKNAAPPKNACAPPSGSTLTTLSYQHCA